MASSLRAQRDSAVDWPSYGNGPLGGRYSPLADINRDNVARLRVLWVYHTGETDSAWATARPTRSRRRHWWSTGRCT